MKQVYIYDKFNRIWHWAQAFLIIFLAVTGFEIHGSFDFFGFETAVRWHNVAAIALIILVAMAIFWHFTTGTWKHYVPSLKNMKEQISFYSVGIFKNAPHPVKKTELSKLNPLQRWVYFGLKILVIPVMIISGILYMLYRYPQKGTMMSLGTDSLETIAIFHTAGAFALVAFIIMHIYLISTGHTVTSNLKAMITGYEDLEEEEKNENETELNTETVKDKFEIQNN
jgi:thiosulfate reductase cytochrome b subunit